MLESIHSGFGGCSQCVLGVPAAFFGGGGPGNVFQGLRPQPVLGGPYKGLRESSRCVLKGGGSKLPGMLAVRFRVYASSGDDRKKLPGYDIKVPEGSRGGAASNLEPQNSFSGGGGSGFPRNQKNSVEDLFLFDIWKAVPAACPSFHRGWLMYGWEQT